MGPTPSPLGSIFGAGGVAGEGISSGGSELSFEGSWGSTGLASKLPLLVLLVLPPPLTRVGAGATPGVGVDWAGGACAGSSGSFSGTGAGTDGGAGGAGSSLGTAGGGAGAGGAVRTVGGAAGSPLSRLSGAPNFSSSRLSFSAQAALRSSCMRRSSSSRRRRARSTARDISDEDCLRLCRHASSSSSGAGGLQGGPPRSG